MIRMLAIALVLATTVAVAQTCIKPAPSAPPSPTDLVIKLPVDGGAIALGDGGTTTGCAAMAIVPNGAPANLYAIGNAKCTTAVGIALQASANDNGWNDGGTP